MSSAPLAEVFRDRWLLVVEKPSGLPSQSARDEGDHALARVLVRDPGARLPHRLDAPASGLLLFVLDPDARRAIAEAFRTHTIERTYAAVACGDVEDGTWDRPIGGQQARTDVSVAGRTRGLSALYARLHTGRTHQVRIHAALAGTPLAGDWRYGGEAAQRWPRLALHATRLAFVHPITREKLELASALPTDLAPLWSEATV